MSRTVLITGCSSGIGHDAALRLTERGWRVLATCRNPEDCAALSGAGLESFPLDYERPETIAAAVEEACARTGGRLDAVFHNGAYAIPGPIEDIPAAAMEAIFRANFLGWHDLTRQLLPLFRAQGAGRIVFCSSVLGMVAMRWRGAYVATKFALEGYADTLRMELRGSGIHVSLIEPGPIRTEFRRNAIRQFERWVDWRASALRADYENGLLDKLYKAGKRPDPGELGPEAVTARLIHALEAPRPRPRYYVTVPTYVVGILKRFLSTRLMDRLLGG